MGRGELQLAILIEMMRREGYELMVGKPEILTRRSTASSRTAWICFPSIAPNSSSAPSWKRWARARARWSKMINHGSGRVRLQFEIPSRGLDRPAQRNADRHQGHGHHEFALPRLHPLAGRYRDRGPTARSSATAPARPPATPSGTCRNAARSSLRPRTKSTKA